MDVTAKVVEARRNNSLLLLVQALVAAFILLPGCRPESKEFFIFEKDAPGGIYTFSMYLDSAETYDFSFYTRIDSPAGLRTCQMPIYVVWTPPVPDCEPLEEQLYMDISKSCSLYRTAVAPKESGEWKIEVFPSDVPEGFRGLGLICKYNGTR